VKHSWSNSFKKFLKLPLHEKGLLFEAFFSLIFAHLVILFVPFRRIAPRLGKHMKETPTALQSQPTEILQQIRQSIIRAIRFIPWESRCLVQGIAGKTMLKRRKIATTLYLGVARYAKKEDELKAHAWLRCGNFVLTGRKGMKQFTVVSIFGENVN